MLPKSLSNSNQIFFRPFCLGRSVVWQSVVDSFIKESVLQPHCFVVHKKDLVIIKAIREETVSIYLLPQIYSIILRAYMAQLPHPSK
jgi:hypothetical protein